MPKDHKKLHGKYIMRFYNIIFSYNIKKYIYKYTYAWNLQIPRQKAISGLDAIFVLGSIAPEDALDRAMGKVHDPLTGEDYHLEMNPPPFQQCK